MKIQVNKKIQINRPVSAVYDIIADISKWNIWSPWIHAEPTCKTQYVGTAGQTGQYQTWDGEVIGSGKMTIVELEKNQRVKMKLEFFKPWKSEADAIFEVENRGADKCEVTWTIHSQLPLFMFFFKKMMVAYMGSDFDRGLRMLKEYAETGAVISKSIYQGEKDFSDFQVLGKKTKCPISEMSKLIPADFNEMNQRLQRGELTQPEFIVTLSHNHDIPNEMTEFTAGYAYKQTQQFKVPSDLQVIQIPKHKALMVDHYGPYRNIGNPWSMIVSYQRGKKKKLNKAIPMYEVYKTMPDGRPEKDIYTQVIAPVK